MINKSGLWNIPFIDYNTREYAMVVLSSRVIAAAILKSRDRPQTRVYAAGRC
jgi:hypothetical protein